MLSVRNLRILYKRILLNKVLVGFNNHSDTKLASDEA